MLRPKTVFLIKAIKSVLQEQDKMFTSEIRHLIVSNIESGKIKMDYPLRKIDMDDKQHIKYCLRILHANNEVIYYPNVNHNHAGMWSLSE